MTRCCAILATVFAASLFPVTLEAAVKVNFIAPESYRDVGYRSGEARAAILSEIRQHLQALGQLYLKPDDSLTIDVLDVDLAGEYEPWRPNLSHARIMRDVAPPMMKLRYRLEQKGRVLIRDTETVSDMNYLVSPSARRSSGRLAYDKEMLRDWFQARFGGRRTPGS